MTVNIIRVTIYLPKYIILAKIFRLKYFIFISVNSIHYYHVQKQILIHSLLDQSQLTDTLLKVASVLKCNTDRTNSGKSSEIWLIKGKRIIFYSHYNFKVYSYYDIIFPTDEIYMKKDLSLQRHDLWYKLLCSILRARLKDPVHRSLCSRKKKTKTKKLYTKKEFCCHHFEILYKLEKNRPPT